ncbi:MAG: nitroreductase family protein [Anaerolineae bacterium]|nr:nitroreductase family protein [Anaerolineae bacterium]
MLRDLVLQNRSYRRFDESVPLDRATLREWVDLARLSASAMNRQPLKFLLSAEPERNAAIFETLGWAGYLPQWPGPAAGERPTGYIVILADTAIRRDPGVDYGIAAQSIMLGAAEKGFGGCMIGSVAKDKLRAALDIAEQYEILLVLALGKPAETVVIDPVGADGSIKYWRDADDVHHVPKRALDDLIVD